MVNSNGAQQADVLIQAGKISAVGPELKVPGDTRVCWHA